MENFWRELFLKLDAQTARVTADSRRVTEGSVYVAVSPKQEHLDEALRRGAAVVLFEKGLAVPTGKGIEVPHCREALGQLNALLRGEPSRSLKMVGITGTSGKSTTSFLVEGILTEGGLEPALLGTIAHRARGSERKSALTTPGAEELQEILAEDLRLGCKGVVMEVSSHALNQRRVAGVLWDVVVFTGLSPEHLDYHKDLDDYFLAKGRLFEECVQDSQKAGKRPKAVVRIGDAWGVRLQGILKNTGIPTLTYGLAGSGADLTTQGWKIGIHGIEGQVDGIEFKSPLMGAFNAENILAAIGVGKSLGLNATQIVQGVYRVPGVPGRLERVSNRRGVHVFVDYAHKPDGLQKVLETLRALPHRRLITVVGCGGDRDRLKRPVMAAIAAHHSSEVILTSDNPRSEDPRAILDQMLEGVPKQSHVRVVIDRDRAIAQAIRGAQAEDIVLIAGKGHETTQEIRGEKIPFDDREVVRQTFLTLDGQNS